MLDVGHLQYSRNQDNEETEASSCATQSGRKPSSLHPRAIRMLFLRPFMRSPKFTQKYERLLKLEQSKHGTVTLHPKGCLLSKSLTI